MINWEGTSLINNSFINSDIVCYGPIYIYNSQLYGMIYCEDTVYVDDDTTFDYNFAINANSIQTNNTRLKEFLGIHDPIIIDGNEYYDIIENQTINEPVTYTKNVYIVWSIFMGLCFFSYSPFDIFYVILFLFYKKRI